MREGDADKVVNVYYNDGKDDNDDSDDNGDKDDKDNNGDNGYDDDTNHLHRKLHESSLHFLKRKRPI